MSYIISKEEHNIFVNKCYEKRGFNHDEAKSASHISSLATYYGNQTHNALKALHLDDLFGSKVGGCIPNVKIEKQKHRFKASEVWNANKKLGQAVALNAFERCIELANEFGIGMISVDNAFHYLYGGAYVIEVAKRGYIAYTNCTSTIAEVVPFGGKIPTLGTNPHSWGFPTTKELGYPICIDWATSAIAMGKIQQLKREGKPVPPNAAIDINGNITQNHDEVIALIPFGNHKGYGLSLINELYGSYIGGFLPTIRGRFPNKDKLKNSCNFFFQVIHPEALEHNFYKNKSQNKNVAAVLEDILKDGNKNCLFPGQMEFQASQKSDAANGLIFTTAEKNAFDQLAEDNVLARLNFKSISN